jgi:hypothetical protein
VSCEVVLEDNLTVLVGVVKGDARYPSSGWMSQSKSHELTAMSLPDDSALASMQWLVLVAKMAR